MINKEVFVRVHWLLSAQFGIDPRIFIRSLRGLPRYIRDYFRFRARYAGRLRFLPCLHDWYDEGGLTRNEYFWQDLLVARSVFKANPVKHVDIGSRIDGFVTHVASFREIEVVDIRPITTQIAGVTFKQADFMNPIEGMENYCDSISCLHALEHFGLGRYGDTISPSGVELGLVNMAKLLKKEGIFYLSVPIGIDRVEFNANRIIDPRIIISIASNNLLKLLTLTVIREGDRIDSIVPDETQLSNLASERYTLGIFTFVKCAEI